jgi:hypothetical protein
MKTTEEGSMRYGLRSEQMSSGEIKEKIIVQFTGIALSRLTSGADIPRTRKKTSLDIDFVSIVKNIHKSLGGLRHDTLGRFSEIVGFDIKKPSKTVTPEEKRNVAEFLINGSYEFLCNLVAKPKNQLKPKEEAILHNFNIFRSPEGQCYTPEKIRELLRGMVE